MSIYELPKIEFPKLLKKPGTRFQKLRVFWAIILTIFIASVFSFLVGIISSTYFYPEVKDFLSKFNITISEPKTAEKEKVVEKGYIPQTSQEEAVISVVKEYSPAVVSIIITKDVPIIEEYYTNPFQEFEQFFGSDPFEFLIPQYQQKGTEKQEVGGGTGFIISEDGMVITNRHVVSDEKADYTVFTTDGKKFPAKVLAKDPVQDLAFLKIDQEKIVDEEGKFTLEKFPQVVLGDSDTLQMGQTVIAIGNALAEFKNTVSVGVISGLGRTITASGGGIVETLEDVIQTDAAINPGNSGGPLLNLKGEVIGINTAMVQQAQTIGFAIPINKAKKDIEQVKTSRKITYPFLGVRYVLITEAVQQKNNLSVDYGVWVQKGSQGEAAIFPGSPAEKAGLKEGDIILEFNGEKITSDSTLAKMITKYNPEDKVVLKILKDGKEENIEVVLGERTE